VSGDTIAKRLAMVSRFAKRIADSRRNPTARQTRLLYASVLRCYEATPDHWPSKLTFVWCLNDLGKAADTPRGSLTKQRLNNAADRLAIYLQRITR
jgi:hypothetical protein